MSGIWRPTGWIGDFRADAPHLKWGSGRDRVPGRRPEDVFVPVLDVFNGEIIAHAVSTSSLSMDVLTDASKFLKPGEHPVLHSDRAGTTSTGPESAPCRTVGSSSKCPARPIVATTQRWKAFSAISRKSSSTTTGSTRSNSSSTGQPVPCPRPPLHRRFLVEGPGRAERRLCPNLAGGEWLRPADAGHRQHRFRSVRYFRDPDSSS